MKAVNDEHDRVFQSQFITIASLKNTTRGFKCEVNGGIKCLEGDSVSSEDCLHRFQRLFFPCPQCIRTLRGVLLFLLSVKLVSTLGFHRTVANSAALLTATISNLFWPTVSALCSKTTRPEKEQFAQN